MLSFNWDIGLYNKIPQIALNNLLKILNFFHTKLPLHSRTLLKTNLSMLSRKLERRELCYMGLLQPLKQFVSWCKSQLQNNEIDISFNINGHPLFKSSNIQLWPILGLIKNCFKNILLSLLCIVVIRNLHHLIFF